MARASTDLIIVGAGLAGAATAWAASARGLSVVVLEAFAAGHKRVYTKSTLLQDLDAAGYRVRECEGFLLKPFDYDSLGRLDVPIVEELFPALFAVGRDVPDKLCCQLYVLASAKES